MNHTDTVRAMYAAFQRGDIDAIIERTAADVEWEYESSPADLPWLKPRRSHQGVRDFFASLGDFEFLRFEPRVVVDAGDGLVLAVVDVDLMLRRNGVRISEPEEVHLFHFAADGKLRRFRHRIDTHKLWLAHKA